MQQLQDEKDDAGEEKHVELTQSHRAALHHRGIPLPHFNLHAFGFGHHERGPKWLAHATPPALGGGTSSPFASDEEPAEPTPVRRGALEALVRAAPRCGAVLDVEGRVWPDASQRVADALAFAHTIHAGDREDFVDVLLTAFEPRSKLPRAPRGVPSLLSMENQLLDFAALRRGDHGLVATRRVLSQLDMRVAPETPTAEETKHLGATEDDAISGWVLVDSASGEPRVASNATSPARTPTRAKTVGAAVVVGTVPAMLRDTMAIARLKRELPLVDGTTVRLLAIVIGPVASAARRAATAKALAQVLLDDEFILLARTCTRPSDISSGLAAAAQRCISHSTVDYGAVVRKHVNHKDDGGTECEVVMEADSANHVTELKGGSVPTSARVTLAMVVPEQSQSAAVVERRATTLERRLVRFDTTLGIGFPSPAERYAAILAQADAANGLARARHSVRRARAYCADEARVWEGIMDPSGRKREELLAAYIGARAAHETAHTSRLLQYYEFAKKYSLFLLVGVIVAIIYANAATENYETLWGASEGTGQFLLADFTIFDHAVSLNFLINDVFMCFFFALATKEITVSCLPGGDLNPPRRAVNPIAATFGGVTGPSIMMIILIPTFYSLGAFGDAAPPLGELIKGWGIPTATDISLAWLVAIAVFGKGHPSVAFLLLLAVADDGIGLIIIAIFYGDPVHPTEPVYLVLVVVAMGVAYAMRRRHVNSWKLYCLIAGPISWAGLALARVHPALALVPIVPIMPDKVFGRPRPQPAAAALEPKASGPTGAVHVSVEDVAVVVNSDADEKYGELREPDEGRAAAGATGVAASSKINPVTPAAATPAPPQIVRADHDMDSPLMAFSEANDGWVRVGMFFFALANAGTNLGGLGPLTWCVWISIVVGKCAGVASVGWLCNKCGFPLPVGVTNKELLMMGLIASLGLTVALFVAGVAYTSHTLQVQSKMGAIFSATSGVFAIIIDRYVDYKGRWARTRAALGIPDPDQPVFTRVVARFPGRVRGPRRDLEHLGPHELRSTIAWRRRLTMYV